MGPNVGSHQQDVEKSVWIVRTTGMEIVIHTAAWGFGSSVRDRVEEGLRDQLYFCHRPNLNRIGGNRTRPEAVGSLHQPVTPRSASLPWPLHHPYEKDSEFVPTANPAHAPAIDSVSDWLRV